MFNPQSKADALDRVFLARAEKLLRLKKRYEKAKALEAAGKVARRLANPTPQIAALVAAQSPKPKRQRRIKPTTSYGAYLLSDHWRVFRLSVIAKRGAKCEVCNAALRTPQLHHLSYERLGKELDTDVIVACDDCHRGYHGIPTLAAMQERFRIEHGIEKCAPGTAQGIRARGRERVVARSRGSS